MTSYRGLEEDIMYLSRLRLNPRSRMVRNEVAMPYQMHRTLLAAFPDAEEGGTGRVLFRLDVHQRTGAIEVLVQSDKKPVWERISSRHPDYFNEPPEHKQFELQLRAGQLARFKLRANPTYRDRQGKRRGHVTEQKQIEWLQRKAEQSGFSIKGLEVHAEGLVNDSSRKEESPLQITAVTFEGLLQVVDSEALKSAVAAGIGSAKGFGFGLLSLAPVEG